MEQLTVKEALEQGYESYFYDGDGFQSPKDLKFVKDIDFTRKISLAEKNPTQVVFADAERIAEMIADEYQCGYHDVTGDDTNSVFEVINEMDFTEVAKKVNEAIASVHYYKSSGIKLVP